MTRMNIEFSKATHSYNSEHGYKEKVTFTLFIYMMYNFCFYMEDSDHLLVETL